MSQSTFLERLRLLYQAVGLLVVVAAVGVAYASLPELYRRVRDAPDSRQRNYYALELAATWCFLYSVTMIVVLAMAPYSLQEVWPTVSWLLLDWDMPHSDSVATDIAISLFLCVPLYIARYFFGSAAADGSYRPPKYELANEHIQEVMSRYHAVLASDPKLDPRWPALRRAERHTLEQDYQAKLADIENRVRTVHQLWHRKSPI